MIKKSHNINVEEIENGFILTKSTDISYTTADGRNDYMYLTKRWYSKEDPIEFNNKNKELADAFSE